MPASHAVAVVGAGAMGAAAAWQLVRRGHRVRVFEQFHRGHSRGSSHGAARIFRLAYPDDDWTGYACRSLDLWRELQEDAGRELIDHVGGVDHGDPAALDRLERSLARAGRGHERLTTRDAGDRWPGMRFDRDVLYHPRAGRVDAAAAVATLLDQAEGHGADVLDNNPVRHVEQREDCAFVHADDGRPWRADRVVVTAGAWAPGLLESVVGPPPMVVTLEQPALFVPRVEADWPTFLHYAPGPATTNGVADPVCAYGLPNVDGRVKIGEHHTGQVVDPDHRPHGHDPGRLARLRDYVNEWFPGLDVGSAEAETCLYTSTASTDFVLDRSGSLVIGAGFSGHGFKFVPWIGERLAMLVEGEPAIARFRIVG